MSVGLASLRALCDSKPYKDWEFEVEPSYDPDPFGPLGRLVVKYPAVDAYRPSARRMQVFQATIPRDIDADIASAEQWIPWLFSVIVFLEHHEAAEFFMPDGRRVYDPHDENCIKEAQRFGLVAHMLPYVMPRT